MVIEIKEKKSRCKTKPQRTLIIKCDNCGNTKEKRFFEEYSKLKYHYCGVKCVNESQRNGIIKEQKQDYFENKYGEGITCAFDSPETQDKIKETLLDRYGYDVAGKIPFIQEQTILNPDSLIKIQETVFKKYGVNSIVELPWVRKAAMLGVQKVRENGKSKDEVIFYNAVNAIFQQAKQNIIIESNNRLLYPDIVIENIIIEYYSDYWHMNPDIYSANDINKNTQCDAETIWMRDRKRNFYLRSLGFVVLVIWENDYKKNKDYVIDYVKSRVNKYVISDFKPNNATISEWDISNTPFKNQTSNNKNVQQI